MFLAATVAVDFVQLATLLSIAVPAASLFVAIARFTKNIEVRLNALTHENQIQNLKLDGALRLLDRRLRDLEKHSEKHSDFTPHHQRDEKTGAPFLEK